MLRKNQQLIKAFYIIIDAIVVIISFIFSFYFTSAFILDITMLFTTVSLTVFALLTTMLSLLCFNLFSLNSSKRTERFLLELVTIIKANLTIYILLLAYSYAISLFFALQIFLTAFFLVSTASLILYRYALRKLLRYLRTMGYNKKYVLLIGVNTATLPFYESIDKNQGFGLSVIGVIANNDIPKPLNKIASIEELDEFFANSLVDEAVICPNDERPLELRYIIDVCERWGVKFSVLPASFAVIGSNLYFNDYDRFKSVSIRKVPLNNELNYIIKRTFDIIISIITLIVTSPIMLATFITIKLTTKSSAIYKQKRVGVNRHEFYMFKFRSMIENSDNSPNMTDKDDLRVTPFGAFIRKYSIDELPQLVNVLKGDMSLVGPRPERPHLVKEFKDSIPLYMVKHYIKPGMTGLAQIKGLRGNTSIEERIKEDIYYIENWSILLDIKILFLTIFKGIFNKNAY